MSKRPQLRKRASSSSSSSCDDDSAKGPTRGPRQGRGVQPKRATLSFGNEDEADSDERPFAVKKSKASRIIKKKMRQAPNAASVVDSVALSERSDASVGGNYSAESLAALRGMQRFSTAPPPAAQELEGPEIVLAGDEAQRAEDDLAVEEDSNGDRALRDKINKLKEERNGDGKKKVKFTNAIPRADDRDFNAVDDQDSATWEEELLKRAGSATRPIGSTLPFQKESRPLKNAEEITFKDFLLSLHGGIEKLNLSLSANCTKLSAVNDECSEAAKEDVAMKSKVELMNEMQGWMEDFRLYCSDVVGMLREKADTIQELMDAIFKIQSDELDSVTCARIERQEQWVCAIREKGKLLSLGGYLPKTNQLLQPHHNSSGSSCVRFCEVGVREVVAALRNGFESNEPHSSLIDYLVFRFGVSGDYAPVAALPIENNKISQLYGAANLLMSDVREDIASVASIMSMFSRLRADHPSRYRSAFISMSLPPLIGELVKLDMISQPFLSQIVRLDERPWHEPLFLYSTTSDKGAIDAISECDDSVLLSKVTLGAVYPVVALAVRSVFDPCSQTMSASLADLISQLLGYDIPLNMSNELFQSLLSKFDASFNSFCFPNLRTNTDADDLSLLICQLWHVHICIRNLGKFKAFLSPSAVTRLIWNLYCSTWSGVIATILTFSSTHIEEHSTDSLCHLGIYVCLRFIVVLCENVSGGQRILETLNFQKHIGNNYDAVLNATYFIKIRELSAALSSEYKNIAGISVDAVMSLAQAALAVLSHFHAALKRAPDSEVGSSLALCGSDISLLCNLVRKSSN